MRTYVTFLFLSLIIAVVMSCTTPMEIGGRCSGSCDSSGINPQPEGSICTAAGVCACPGGTRACCPDGPPGKCQTGACAPEDACPNVGAGSGGGTSGGNDGGPDPAPECASDTDCDELATTECERAACVAGNCDVSTFLGPTPSQRYGDCKRRECNASGDVVEIGDDSDYFNDGLECTIDFCKDGASQNLSLADGSPCGADNYCYQNTCVECVDWMPGAKCGQGLTCDELWCEPTQQCIGQCSGLCAPCPTGTACANDIDCASLNCSNGACAPPSCSDGSANGGETGVDCGASTCGPCPDGEGCHAHADCISQVCYAAQCQAPSCSDGVQNGMETGIDCRGSCKPCLQKKQFSPTKAFGTPQRQTQAPQP